MLAWLLGPYMAKHDYGAEEIALASCALGFVIPNLLGGVINLGGLFMKDPAGFVIDILSRFKKK